jgi:hypothetical protein
MSVADQIAAAAAAAANIHVPVVDEQQQQEVPRVNVQNNGYNSLKLVDFWQDDPDLWFERAEAQFRRANVHDDRSKADCLIPALSPLVLKSVRNIIADRTAPDTTLYHRLKERLLRRFSPSSIDLAAQVIHHPSLGDLKPSQLLDSMLALMPPGEPPGMLFKQLFLEKLPSEWRSQLAASEAMTPGEMAVVADRMYDARIQRVSINAAVHSQRSGSPGGSNQRSGSPGRGGRRRSPARRGRDSTPGSSSLCFYHSRFGVKANKCVPPCNWSENGQAAGGN